MTHHYPDSPDAPWELLARHLAAEVSEAERQTLREWVQADATHLQILTTVTRAWERASEAAALPVSLSATDVEAAWQRFRPRIPVARAARAAEAPAEAAPAAPATLPVSRFRWPLQRRQRARWSMVAGVLLIFGAGFWLRGLMSRPLQTVVTYTAAEHRRQLQLPDGSTVWLNAHSWLRYAGAGSQASTGARTVQLGGEAYFEVVHNPARPFRVYTATTLVRVTGTAFNVRAYAAEDSVDVSVTQGRVWVRRLVGADSVLLTANTRIAIHAADAPGRPVYHMRRASAGGANFRAWQTDTLRFQDASAAQVIRTLRVTFGTAVRLTNPSIGQCRFTGTFVRPQPEQVLTVLAATTASRLEPDGSGGYSLQGPGCGSPAATPDTSAAATPTPSRD
jgi:transmembrane sensor